MYAGRKEERQLINQNDFLSQALKIRFDILHRFGLIRNNARGGIFQQSQNIQKRGLTGTVGSLKAAYGAFIDA